MRKEREASEFQAMGGEKIPGFHGNEQFERKFFLTLELYFSYK